MLKADLEASNRRLIRTAKEAEDALASLDKEARAIADIVKVLEPHRSSAMSYSVLSYSARSEASVDIERVLRYCAKRYGVAWPEPGPLPRWGPAVSMVNGCDTEETS